MLIDVPVDKRFQNGSVPKLPPPPPPTIKNGSCLNVRISVTSKISSYVFSISETEMVPVHDYEKRNAEAFAITMIRMFKHEPFFIVGAEGGGAYSWYFTGTCTGTETNHIW